MANVARTSITAAEAAEQKQRQMAVWRIGHEREKLAREREQALAPLAAELETAELNETKERGRLDSAIERAEAMRQRYRETEASFTARAAALDVEATALGIV